jgi:hypothetical protein
MRITCLDYPKVVQERKGIRNAGEGIVRNCLRKSEPETGPLNVRRACTEETGEATRQLNSDRACTEETREADRSVQNARPE